ncbi:MAG: DUF975 family protein [Pontiella sp.]
MAGLDESQSEIPSLKIPDFETSGRGVSNQELMDDARKSLSGNWGMAILGYFLYVLLSIGISLFVFSSTHFVGAIALISGNDPGMAMGLISVFSQLFQFVICGPLVVGFYGFYLGMVQEDEGKLELLFVGFRRFLKSFATYFLSSLFILLWTLLFIIPGLIAAFRYSMAYFCIADDEDCGPLEAIRLSKEMMKGNKWKFFCLNCRFIGWWFLATFFTSGIGYLWLIPYVQTSYAKFYEDVKSA